MAKVFVVDVAKCNGCYNCQVVCKDEHCGQSWLPFAAEQPTTGQFWCKVDQKERGQYPVVRIAYEPHFDAQDEAIRAYAPEVLMKREDGIIVIDPEKAAGRKDIADRFEGVYWNEELQIPQGCTGCAHLLDDGWTVPRCVDACCTDALQFGDEEDFDLSDAVKLTEGSKVYYRNLPKRFVAGTIIDPEAEEVVIGAQVELKGIGGFVAQTETDDFGDFKFDQVEAQEYVVTITAPGYEKLEVEVDATEQDRFVGELEAKYCGALSAEERSAEIAHAARVIMEEHIAQNAQRAEAARANASDAGKVFTVVCPHCGKSFTSGMGNADVTKCQFCKADISEYLETLK